MTEVENKPGQILEALNAKERNNEIVNSYKKLYLKRYNIEGVNLEEEFQKIQKKESRLSRSQRDAVVAAMQIFPMMEKKLVEQNEIEDLPVDKPATEEDLKEAITEETQKRLAEKFIQNSQKSE